MSYLLHATKKRNRNPFKKILLILLVCFILGYLARGFIVNFIVDIGGGIKSIVTFIIPSGLRSDNALVAENNSLREQVVSLTALNADRNVLSDENTNLKFLLGRKENASSTKSTTKSKNILATIKQSPAETPFDTFIIDAGIDILVNDEQL